VYLGRDNGRRQRVNLAGKVTGPLVRPLAKSEKTVENDNQDRCTNVLLHARYVMQETLAHLERLSPF
jgi:hypothetical protein